METNFSNNTPIYLQLVEELKAKILIGEYRCGDKLPSIRDFALTFKVNPNTIQKALVELEDLGLIYTERTNGKFITKEQVVIDKLKNEYSNKLCESFLIEMSKIGFSKDMAIYLLKNYGGKN